MVFRPGWPSALALVVGISLLTFVFVEGAGVVVSASLGPAPGAGTSMADERLARPARFLRDNEGDEDDGGLVYVLLVRFGRLVVLAIFVIITGIETVIVFYFSYVYKQSVVDKIPQMTPPTGNQGLKHGLFAGCCWNDCQTCLARVLLSSGPRGSHADDRRTRRLLAHRSVVHVP